MDAKSERRCKRAGCGKLLRPNEKGYVVGHKSSARLWCDACYEQHTFLASQGHATGWTSTWEESELGDVPTRIPLAHRVKQQEMIRDDLDAGEWA